MALNLDDWYELRNFVVDAAPGNESPPVSLPNHPAVNLVRQFIASGNHSFLDEAAKMVAIDKPGVDPQVAIERYWLVLDKS